MYQYCGSSRNCGMSDKKPSFIYFYKLSNDISSITESIKFARRLISIQRHHVKNDVIYEIIIFERDSQHLTNVRKWTMTTSSLNWSSHE